MLILVILAAGLVGLQITRPSAALALGPGRACVFYYPFGDGFVGHTAWAFLVPGSNTWIYGSSDGSDGGNSPHRFDPAPILHGDWVMSTGNGFNDVASTFRERAYTAYTCRNTPSSAVGAAQNLAFNDRAYNFLTNNCAHHTDDILSAYYGGTFSVHYADTDLIPQDWFNSLQGSSGQGFEPVQPIYAPAGFKGGTVMTDNLAMRDAGSRGPVSLNSPIHRRAGLGTGLVIVCWMDGPTVTETWSTGATYSSKVWDAVNDGNASTLTQAPRYAVADASVNTGGDTSRLVPHC